MISNPRGVVTRKSITAGDYRPVPRIGDCGNGDPVGRAVLPAPVGFAAGAVAVGVGVVPESGTGTFTYGFGAATPGVNTGRGAATGGLAGAFSTGLSFASVELFFDIQAGD